VGDDGSGGNSALSVFFRSIRSGRSSSSSDGLEGVVASLLFRPSDLTDDEEAEGGREDNVLDLRFFLEKRLNRLFFLFDSSSSARMTSRSPSMSGSCTSCF
jgi:hypothetical protein